MWPLARTDDVLAGFYVADDGRVNPVDVTMSLAKGARQLGARIIEGVAVTGVLTEGRRGHRRADRAQGDIEAEYVVNCAGMWARQLGELAGVQHPAAGGRALLPADRADRRGRPGTGRCWRTRPTTATSARRAAA